MQPKKTRFFKHYKNKPYRYLGIARHSETLEELVLYETLYPNELGKLWVRPKEMFFEDVTIEGKVQPRFKQIEFNFKSFDMLSESEIEDILLIGKQCFKRPYEKAEFLSILESHPHQFHFVAYEENKMVGYKLGFKRSPSRFYSWNGAVTPAYQGLGVASELMRRQHEWCQQQKFKFIETKTSHECAAMISLNLAHGFKIIGTAQTPANLIQVILEKGLAL
jgi:GNAT superfamily N-acetyltransferase